MTNQDLGNLIYKAWNAVADDDVRPDEVLNALMEKIADNITLNEGELFYINVYWHDDVDLDDTLLDVIRMFKDLKIKAYTALDSSDYSATAVAIVYKGGK